MSSKTKGFFNKNFYFDKCIQGVLLGTVVTIIFVAIYILQLTADNNKSLIFRFVLTLFSFGPTILYFIIPWMILMLVGTSIVLLLDKRFMQKKRKISLFIKNILLTMVLGIIAMVTTAVVYLTALVLFLILVGGIRS